MQYLIYILLLLACPLSAWGDNEYLFHFLNTSNGLSSSTVMSMYVDSQGFLWIGTETGLNRYDGYEIQTHYNIGGTYQLNNVSNLDEDANGNIWIFNSNTHAIYNIHNHTFEADATAYLHSLGIDVKAPYIVKTKGQALWVVDEGRIQYYDCKSGDKQSWRVPAIKSSNMFESGSLAVDGGIYLSFDDGVWHFTKASGRIERLNLPSAHDTYGVYEDADGTIWVYSILSDYICRYSIRGKETKSIVRLSTNARLSDNNAIRDIMDDDAGNVWIATDHEGVFLFSKHTEQVTNVSWQLSNRYSLASNNATCLQKDRQGTMWIGHYKTGVSYTASNYRMFKNRGQHYGDVSTMAFDAKGQLWIGTDGNGLYVEAPDGSYRKTPLPNITISSILPDSDGSVWVGTYNKGLYHMSSATSFTHYSKDDNTLPSNNVWRMVGDAEGRIWYVSAMGSLTAFDKSTHESRVVTDDEGYPINGYALTMAGQKLYAGSFYGLWEIDIHTCKAKRMLGNKAGTQSFHDNMIISIHYDRLRHILMLGHMTGLTLYDTASDTIHTFDQQPALANRTIRSLLQDKNGNYWISTSRGLSCIIPDTKHGHTSWNIRDYTTREGLQTIYFNGQSQAVSPDGHILFGGTEGYTIIDPELFVASDNASRHPFITDISVGGKSISSTAGIITLDHDNTNLTIRYFTGDLNSANHISYAYMLKGIMNDWTYTDANHISLVGLSPGKYLLQIRTLDDDSEWSAPCELTIIVRPPFYLSWWMQLIYWLLAAGALAFLFFRYHRRQAARLANQKLEMERTKQEQLTDMKLKFFTNISHDLRTPLTLIISPLDTMVKKMERGEASEQSLPMLKNMLKNAQLLYSQVTSLLDFRRLDVGVETLQADISDIVAQLGSISMSFHDYAEEKGINLQFHTDASSFLMSYDKEKMSKIIYNLLSNAFKFTPSGGSITLSFTHDDKGILIEVADTGQGISDQDKKNIFDRFYQSSTNDSTQTGSGIGLHIANEYVQLHQGTLTVRDNAQQGSVFSISIPATGQAEQPASAQATVPDAPDHDSQQPTVLVVDDNHDMLTFITSNLQQSYRVLTALNGKEALAQLQNHDVNLVVSDVMMPVMDGLELCRHMKSDINLSHVPIILLTARTTDDDQLEGLQLGADDYVTKPFNMEVLALRIAKFMEWSAASHRTFHEKIDISPSEITITPLDEQFIKRAIQLVEQHMDDSTFTVETLGDAVGMSRSCLYKKLMAITGQGPSEFIRTIRIKRGRALLEKSQMQITEIAYAVGFNSLKSFSMNFKAEYGITPSEFLKSLKNN